MTKAGFEKQDGKFVKLTVRGHSGYAEEGSDIVCAAISASLDLAASVLDETGTGFKFEADGRGTLVTIELADADDASGQAVLAALYKQLSELAEIYPENVKVTEADRFRL